MTKRSPFPNVRTRSEIIRLAAMLYARSPLLLCKVARAAANEALFLIHWSIADRRGAWTFAPCNPAYHTHSTTLVSLFLQHARSSV